MFRRRNHGSGGRTAFDTTCLGSGLLGSGRALVGLGGAAAGLVAALLPLPVGPAQAAEPAVEMVLTAVEADADGLSLSLTVANDGSVAWHNAEVMLWREQRPITDQAELADRLADDDSDTGGRLGWPNRDAYHVLAAGDDSFEPGASASPSLTATWDQLGLVEPGVYLVGAQLHATAADQDGQVVAQARCLIVRPGDSTADRVVVVALTSAIPRVGDEFADDQLAAEMAPRAGPGPGTAGSGGRLTELAWAAVAGADWLIDPALYQAALVMAAGYQVRQDDQLVPGRGGPAAASWLALVDSLPLKSGYRTPWGDPDLVLAGQLDDQGAAERAAAAWQAALTDPAYPVTALADLPLVWAPAGGLIDAAAARAAAALAPTVVLADVAEESAAADWGAADWGRVALLAPTLPEADPDRADQADADLRSRQQGLAEDYLAAVAGRPSLWLITTAAEAGPSLAPLPDWVRRRHLGEAATETVAGAGARAATTDRPTTRLNQANATANAVAEDHLLALSELTGQPDPDLTAALAAAWSQDWPDPAAALAHTAWIEDQIGTSLGQVRAALFDNIILTSHDTTFPISISNSLAQAVRVRLELASSSPVRLSAELGDVITVEPGDRVTIPVSPTIRADGTVTVTIRLTTDAGRPFGEAVTAQVQINQSGRLAWIIVIVSGLVLAVGTVLRVKSGQPDRAARLAAARAETADPGGDHD
jgi:hypothetical protein